MSTREDRVDDWLLECKQTKEAGSDLNELGKRLLNNATLIDLICDFYVDSITSEVEAFEAVCMQLLELYRSQDENLLRFARQFIPVLAGAYLCSKCQGLEGAVPLEVLILGIYNAEVLNEKGLPKVQRVRVPNLSNPSIYHDPSNSATLGLFDPSLVARHLGHEPLTLELGPYPSVDTLNVQNRYLVISALLRTYNSNIVHMKRESLTHACRMFSRFNDLALPAIQALEDVNTRAGYELWPDILLMSNAVINSLLENPSGQPSEGPMGIKIDASGQRRGTIKAGLLTNASFKATKLPEDIPMPKLPQELSGEHSLSTLTEESEGSTKGDHHGVRAAAKRVGNFLHVDKMNKMKISHSDMSIKSSSSERSGLTNGYAGLSGRSEPDGTPRSKEKSESEKLLANAGPDAAQTEDFSVTSAESKKSRRDHATNGPRLIPSDRDEIGDLSTRPDRYESSRYDTARYETARYETARYETARSEDYKTGREDARLPLLSENRNSGGIGESVMLNDVNATFIDDDSAPNSSRSGDGRRNVLTIRVDSETGQPYTTLGDGIQKESAL